MTDTSAKVKKPENIADLEELQLGDIVDSSLGLLAFENTSSSGRY